MSDPEVLPGNGLISSLTGAISTFATTLAIQAGDVAGFPEFGTYRAVLFTDPVAGPWEIVTVVGGQGTGTLTILRASEPYNGAQVARPWPLGTKISPVITKEGLMALLGGATGSLLYMWANYQ